MKANQAFGTNLSKPSRTGRSHAGLAGLLAAALVLVTSCSPEPEAGATDEHAGHDHAAHDAGAHAGDEVLELFTENKGVLLPDQLKRDLGIETAEVTERDVIRRFDEPARVYRAARAGRPAGAVVWWDTNDAQWLAEKPTVSLGDDEIEGRLVRTGSAGTDISGRVEVLIEFSDPEARFPVGSTVTARFTAAVPRPSLTVPRSAVIQGAAGAFVFASNGDHYSRAPVVTGVQADGWVEIINGLYEGDVVVTGAVEALWLIELCALKGGTPCCPVPES